MGKQLLPLLSWAVLFGLLLQSCARANASDGSAVHSPVALGGIQFAKLTTALECKNALVSDQIAIATHSSALDSSSIRILNWNVKKGEEPGWELDLAQQSLGKQLVLLQEAALSMRLPAQLRGMSFATFSPGYVKDDDVTGVVTFSDVEPLSHCRLGAREPWLGTPKSANVTQYALSDTHRSLLVVNIHALNFSLGLVAYREQFSAIAEVLRDHAGPVILAGDFNTWRPGRRKVVQEYVVQLGLQQVKFTADHRTQVFGMPLDHVFTRGLTVIEAAVSEVVSSDHNPMTATFALP